MEKYEIAKSNEEREKDISKITDFLRENGIKSCDKVPNLFQENEYNFGIFNDFPKLSEADKEKQDKLFREREELIIKYEKIRRRLLPLVLIENNLWDNLREVNQNICELEGHRLSTDVTEEVVPDEIGRPDIYYFRTCLVCGKRVYREKLKDNDVVVKGEKAPQRILYRR